MAQTYSTEAALYLNSTPAQMANGAVVGGRLRRYRATIALAGQVPGDTIVLNKLPAGSAFSHGMLTSSASLGSATVAVGIAGDAGKYRAAAVFTAADTPTAFGKASAVDDEPLAADETVILTIGAAALPASGTLVVDLYAAGT